VKYRVKSLYEFSRIRFINIISIYLDILKAISSSLFPIELDLSITSFTLTNTLH